MKELKYKNHTIECHLSGWYSVRIAGRIITTDTLQAIKKEIDSIKRKRS
jgi:hypothetical protein